MITCSNSTACSNMNGVVGFCNFDYGTSGFCQTCSTIEYGECKNSENSGLKDEKGQTECSRICGEGNEILSKSYNQCFSN